jgi:hypothetical protein
MCAYHSSRNCSAGSCVIQGIFFYRKVVVYRKLCSTGSCVLQNFVVGNSVIQKLCSAGNIVLQNGGLQ